MQRSHDRRGPLWTSSRYLHRVRLSQHSVETQEPGPSQDLEARPEIVMDKPTPIVPKQDGAHGPSMASDIWREYEEWDAAHATMKITTPREGRDYLKHAKNLLPFLVGIAEIHPIAKGKIYHISPM